MTIERRQIYSSSNGDRWYLAREIEDGRVFIQHRANAPSGGQIEDVEIRTFLRQSNYGPEHQELMRLIGTLVEGREVPDPPYE